MKLFCLLVIGLLSLSAKSVELNDFYGLMGQATPHWHFVRQSQDVEFLAQAKAVYDKHYEAQFTTGAMYKIPPVVHFIWLGPRPFPPQSVENVRTWIAQNPGWTVKFWTDRERETPCEGMQLVFVKDFYFSKLGRCYEESNNWGEKADILRYEILFKEGGVYVDHDVNCLRPFAGMHRGFDLFCCLETPHEPFVGRSITCGNGVIGARPRHLVMEHVLDLVLQRWDEIAERYRGKDDYSRVEIVMQRTYIALSDAVRKAVGQGDNVDIILPAAYFFSKSGVPALYSQHFWATTWDESRVKKSNFEKETEKALGKVQQKNHNLSVALKGLVALNVAIVVVAVAYRVRRIRRCA